jgi:hypothetical protein
VFNTILGIPAHPLLIHAAVIFIPLLIVGAIVYAAWPPFHPRITWAVLALAVIAPFSALFAKLSGTDLKNRLHRDGLTSKDLFDRIAVHNSYGDKTFWWTLALGVLTLALLWYYRGGQTPTMAVRAGSTVVMVVVGAIVGYYVFKTGDTGAHIVWKGI